MQNIYLKEILNVFYLKLYNASNKRLKCTVLQLRSSYTYSDLFTFLLLFRISYVYWFYLFSK